MAHENKYIEIFWVCMKYVNPQGQQTDLHTDFTTITHSNMHHFPETESVWLCYFESMSSFQIPTTTNVWQMSG